MALVEDLAMTDEQLKVVCEKMVEKLAVAPRGRITDLTPEQKLTIASLIFVAYEKGRDEGRAERGAP